MFAQQLQTRTRQCGQPQRCGAVCTMNDVRLDALRKIDLVVDSGNRYGCR